MVPHERAIAVLEAARELLAPDAAPMGLLLLFFPEGIAYDGIRCNRTAVTATLFRH